MLSVICLFSKPSSFYVEIKVKSKVGTEKYFYLLLLFMINNTTVIMLEKDIIVSLQLVNYILNLKCVFFHLREILKFP